MLAEHTPWNNRPTTDAGWLRVGGVKQFQTRNIETTRYSQNPCESSCGCAVQSAFSLFLNKKTLLESIQTILASQNGESSEPDFILAALDDDSEEPKMELGEWVEEAKLLAEDILAYRERESIDFETVLEVSETD